MLVRYSAQMLNWRPGRYSAQAILRGVTHESKHVAYAIQRPV